MQYIVASNPHANDQQTVNEIIVKIEMKKFQNLINNRMARKNNLVTSDHNRVYPLNKIIDGSAKEAEAPLGFTEGILKLNPKLFKYYEKMNRGKNKSEYSPTTATRAMRSQAANSSTITFKKNNYNVGPPRPPATSYGA